jgi:hypothetical protein
LKLNQFGKKKNDILIDLFPFKSPEGPTTVIHDLSIYQTLNAWWDIRHPTNDNSLKKYFNIFLTPKSYYLLE